MFLLSSLFVGAVYYFRVMSLAKAKEAIFAKQASHSRPTSRFGGIAAILALLVGIFLTYDKITFYIVLSMVPVFLAGAFEDLGFDIKPFYRLLASIVSGFSAIYLTGTWLIDVDLTILTPILMISPLAVCFTAFASAGISNSINLIDGVNGLAGGVIAIISSALCIISFLVNEFDLVIFCLLILGAVLGFFIWNFPKGLVFLGDAGAYSFGHCLTWVAILLISRHPEISAWAISCIFFWPIMDTGFAIYRRLIKRVSINQPDRLHFHQLIMRVLILSSRGKISRELANPLSTVIILPLCGLVSLMGVIFLNENSISFITILTAVSLFCGGYRLVVNLGYSKLLQKFFKSN